MESLICELHFPEPNEPSEQSSVQAHLAWQRMSRAGPRLGSVPSLEISALYDSVPSRVSRAELALLTLPSLQWKDPHGGDEARYRRWTLPRICRYDGRYNRKTHTPSSWQDPSCRYKN